MVQQDETVIFRELNEPTSQIFQSTLEKQNEYIDNRLRTIKNRILDNNIKFCGCKEDIANFLNLGTAQNLIQLFFKFKEQECVICKLGKDSVRQLERAHCNKYSRYDLLLMAIDKLFIDDNTPINSRDILIEFIKCHSICPIYYLCNQCHKRYDNHRESQN